MKQTYLDTVICDDDNIVKKECQFNERERLNELIKLAVEFRNDDNIIYKVSTQDKMRSLPALESVLKRIKDMQLNSINCLNYTYD